MDKKASIMEIIECYFPKGLCFDSIEYQSSIEYKRMLQRRKAESQNNSDSDYFYNKLCNRFPQYEVVNWSDVLSNNCFEYRILLHENQDIMDDDIELISTLNGHRFDLMLFISFISDYYCFSINKTVFDFQDKNWSFKTIFEYPVPFQSLVEELRNLMDELGYQELGLYDAQKKICDIETEFIEKGELTVFNCLFSELTSLIVI